MENKYFVPEVEDIRVRYEYEWRGDCPDNSHWRPAKMRDIGGTWNAGCRLYDINEMLEYELIRVPYLTKEQIEAEGWRGLTLPQGSDHMWIKTINGKTYELNLWPDNSYTLTIGEFGDNESCLFWGKCKDVNTLRYICKLLGI